MLCVIILVILLGVVGVNVVMLLCSYDECYQNMCLYAYSLVCHYAEYCYTDSQDDADF